MKSSLKVIWKVRRTLENLDEDGKIMLKWILKREQEGLDLIYVTQNREERGAVVNVKIVLCVHKCGTFVY